jgi:signal transduction histidine kinase
LDTNPTADRNRYFTTLERLLAIKATAVKPALNEASDLIAGALGAEKVDAFVYEEATQTLVALGTSDTALARKEAALGLDRLPIANGGRAVQVYRTGQVFRHGALETDEQELLGIREHLKIRSTLSAPLAVAGVRRGVIQVDSTRPGLFTSEDAAFLVAVADWVGLVMHRSEAVEQLTREARTHARRLVAEEIVTVLAHDLRNYLAPMTARVEALRTLAQRDGHASYVTQARELGHGLNRLRDLLNDLLDVARLERGLFEPDRRLIDLAALVREATLAMQSPALTFQLRLTEPLTADVDPKRIRQALDNLLSNAARYAPGTEVTIELQQSLRDGVDTAVISVEDHGPGIAPEFLPRLSAPFVRGTKGRGLGIGLYLVRGIAEAHGGKLEVESTLGSGSVFRLLLPISAS